MVADRKPLFARLEELGIASTTVEHAPMFTVEQSKSLHDTLPGAHTKSLFLTDKDGRISREEFQNPWAGSYFRFFDKNQDGFLDRDEINARPGNGDGKQ